MIKKVKISEVKLNPNNPRIVKDDKFKKLVQSIKDFPQMLSIRPIVVNADMIVLGGNMRLKACKEAGLKEVSIIQASDLTEEQQREFIIKDNVGYGEWDWEMIANEWDEKKLNDWGLDIPDFKPQELEAEEDDYEIPDEIKTDIVLGDLFEIGPHRLLCGNSTDADAVARLMNGEKADMVFTDPPYGIDCVSSSGVMKKKYKQFENDNTPEFFIGIYNSMPDFFENCVIWGGNFFAHGLPQSKHWIVWEKNTTNKNGEQIRKDQSDCELAYTTLKSPTIRRFTFIWNLFREGNRIDEMQKRVHPNQKPVGLFTEIFNHYNFGNLIADIFMGSGSTMVAAHKTNRKCYGMELDPKYCQVIVDRMMKLDPNIEVKRNGNPYVKTTG